MERDKSLLELAGTPQVARTARLLEGLVSRVTLVGAADCLEGLGFPVLEEASRRGAIFGVAAAMASSRTPWSLIVACDLPFLTPDWIEHLVSLAQDSDADMILPAEVLCMMCHERCTPALLEELGRARPKLGRVMGTLKLQMVTEEDCRPYDPEGRLFFNVNTPEDYEMARVLMGGDTPARA
jgi:molybdopterin-guanine dinucleotide biosynthesis protein A